MNVLQKILSVIMSLLFHFTVTGQALIYPYSPVNFSSARFSQTCHDPLVAVMSPATTPYTDGFEVGLFSEKKYLTDINVLILAAAFSFDRNGVGIMFQHYGIDEYSEKTFGVVYGKQLGKVNLGVGLQYINIDVQANGAAGYLQSTISFLLTVTDNVTTSIKIMNPNIFIAPKEGNLRLASGYTFGLGWQASPVVYTGMETFKQENLPLAVIFNLQYRFARDLSSMITWSTATNQPKMCIGWTRARIRMEAGCAYHAVLGVSPTFSVVYKNQVAGK